MAVLNPLYLNGVDYNAEDERRGLSGLVAQSSLGVVRSGVLGPVPAVSLSGSTVQVGPFNGVVGTAKGGYLTGVDSVTSAGTLTPADQTNGRLDRVILEVLDPDNGTAGSERGRRLRIVTGTPAALPGLPPLPINSLHVAQIQVPRSGAGNPVVTVDCPFTAAVGGVVPVRSQADRDALASPVQGQMVRRLDDRNNIEIWTGTKWDWEPAARGMLLYDAQTVVSSALLNLTVVRANLFTFRAGRRYRISWVAEYYTDAADASNITQLAIQKSAASDTNASTTGLTMIKKGTVSAKKANQTEFFNLAAIYTPTADETVKLKLTAQRVGGTGSLFIVGEPNRAAELLIEDLGAQA